MWFFFQRGEPLRSLLQYDELPKTRLGLVAELRDPANQEAWKEFFDLYAPLVCDHALAKGLDQPEAEDALQETMRAVLLYVSRFNYEPDKHPFRRWIFQVADSQIEYQRRKRQPATLSLETNFDEDGEGLSLDATARMEPEGQWGDEPWDRAVLEVAIDRAKKRVEPKSYQLFDLVMFKQWTVEKIVSTLEVSRQEVYSARFRVWATIEEEGRRLLRLHEAADFASSLQPVLQKMGGVR